MASGWRSPLPKHLAYVALVVGSCGQQYTPVRQSVVLADRDLDGVVECYSVIRGETESSYHLIASDTLAGVSMYEFNGRPQSMVLRDLNGDRFPDLCYVLRSDKDHNGDGYIDWNIWISENSGQQPYHFLPARLWHVAVANSIQSPELIFRSE